MLLKFRCTNFRSIRERQELSLIAVKTRSDEKEENLIATPFSDLRMLRCAGIWGPNASGKSNVLDALAAFRRIVSASWRSWKPTGPIPEFDPFLLDEASRESRTEFELTFSTTDKIYRYGFSFDQKIFHEEKLVDTTAKDRILFHRSSELPHVKYPSRNLGKTSADRRRLESIEQEVRPNSLFLSAAAQKAHPVLAPIYANLSENFRTMHWENMPGRESYTAEKCSDENYREKILSFLRFADAGINDIEFSRKSIPEDERKTLDVVVAALKEAEPEKYSAISLDVTEFSTAPQLRMVHTGAGGRRYVLDESKESDGTKAYLSAIGPVLDALRDGSVLLIDELEASLHPLLARELLRIFNSPRLNPKGAQFIFTTHNSNLLDLDLLRRDQIWFTQKNEEGATHLFRMSEFQPRTNQNIEAGYLGGRFGATPFLDAQLLERQIAPEQPIQASLEFTNRN
jgi:AAA15 family ATPase/GTPase